MLKVALGLEFFLFKTFILGLGPIFLQGVCPTPIKRHITMIGVEKRLLLKLNQVFLRTRTDRHCSTSTSSMNYEEAEVTIVITVKVSIVIIF